MGDFRGGPVVKNLLSDAGDLSSIPDWETKIPHSEGQLSPTATTEPELSRVHAAHERSRHAAEKPSAATEEGWGGSKASLPSLCPSLYSVLLCQQLKWTEGRQA